MFEAKFKTLLASDDQITSLLSTYESEPAIFSEFAPENADLPYIVFKIEKYPSASKAIDRFNIYCDYFEYGTSYKNARIISERIEFICDIKQITDDSRYSNIRLDRSSSGSVPEPSSPKKIHYNIQIQARGSRYKWMQQL